MKKLILTAVLVVSMSTTLFGTWAVIPIDELVAESDLIVVGTLYSATENDESIGNGYIQVDEIIFGNARTQSKQPLNVGDSLKIEWADNWACASGMHMGRVGKRGIWLLQVKPGGIVDAGYPGRFITDEKEFTVRKLVRPKKNTRSVELDVKPRVTLSPQSDSAENTAINKSLYEADLGSAAIARASLTFFLAFGLFFILYRKRFGI